MDIEEMWDTKRDTIVSVTERKLKPNRITMEESRQQGNRKKHHIPGHTHNNTKQDTRGKIAVAA